VLVGAGEKEVAVMGTLTSNLHLMMSTFYKPTSTRYRILCEARAFPSDQVGTGGIMIQLVVNILTISNLKYAFAAQASLHGHDPKDTVIELEPRAGEFTLREEDILRVIKEDGSAIALVLFGGVQYYTGQCFPMQSITSAAHAEVIPLRSSPEFSFIVHFSGLYSGMGPCARSRKRYARPTRMGRGFCSLVLLQVSEFRSRWHRRFIYPPKVDGKRVTQVSIHRDQRDLVTRIGDRFAGWWGHNESTRFNMPSVFDPIPGAQGFQQSNPSALAVSTLLGSLQVFEKAGGMKPIRTKSVAATGYLEALLKSSPYYVELSQVAVTSELAFTIITPSEIESRGAQLSLLFLPIGSKIMPTIFQSMMKRGVIGDERNPDVIRLAPAPLYSSFRDCKLAAEIMNKVFSELKDQ